MTNKETAEAMANAVVALPNRMTRGEFYSFIAGLMHIYGYSAEDRKAMARWLEGLPQEKLNEAAAAADAAVFLNKVGKT